MRCILSNRKVRRLRRETGLDIIMAFTRGGWGHGYRFVLRTGTTGWYERGKRPTLQTGVWAERWEVTLRLITWYGLPKESTR